MRNLKVLGLALVAILALSAVVAGAASANYTSNSKTTVIHGNSVNTHVFTTSVGSITCHTATFLGHAESAGNIAPYTVKTARVLATYTNCTAFGFNANVNMNGCEYEVLEPTSLKAATSIVCPLGKTIVISVPGICNMTVGSQSPGGQVTFANTGSGNSAHVTANAAITGISYGGNCGSGNNATYNGDTTVKGYTSTALTTQTGISVM